MNREDWLALRRTFIGGSDLHRILSGDQLGVWAEKKNLVEPQPDNEWLRWGRRLEQAILEEYADREGLAMEFPDEPIRHKELPYLGGTLDAIASNSHGDRWVVDAKSVDISKSKLWGADGSDEAPEQYVLQVNHYCFVGEFSRGDLATLIAGNRFKVYPIPYDPELAAEILPILEQFWWHVESGREPDPNFAIKGALALQKKLHPGVSGEIVSLPYDGELYEKALMFERVKKAIKYLDGKKEAIEAELRHYAGDAARATIGETGVEIVRTPRKGFPVAARFQEPTVAFSVKFPKDTEIKPLAIAEGVAALEAQ